MPPISRANSLRTAVSRWMEGAQGGDYKGLDARIRLV